MRVVTVTGDPPLRCVRAPRLASSLRGVSAVSRDSRSWSRADACPSSIGGKPWIIEQEIQQITTVAIPSPIDANGLLRGQPDAQSGLPS
ncbi:unnamed protein product, partial [Mesorhabditis spiculigera]